MTQKQRLLELYHTQKKKVQKLVREPIKNYKKQITEKIMEDGDRSRNIWNHMKELKGSVLDKKKEIEIHDENGNKLGEVEMVDEMKTFWKTVYQCRTNGTIEIWNTEARNEYRQTWENDRIDYMNFMEKLEISKEDVRAQLKLIKRKKSTGSR